MTRSLRPPFAAFVLASALAGMAAPALADSFYTGIDPHNPPGMQNRGPVLVPMVASPYYVDTMPTGSIYVDPMPTGSIYVAPVPGGSFGGTPAEVRERYMNEHHGNGQGDYYQGIIPPAPAP